MKPAACKTTVYVLFALTLISLCFPVLSPSLQATAAAMTETWCDRINERIRLEAEQEGLYTRPRFSPGYGDLPLDLQREISAILNMSKEIGVSLTDTMLMTPSKSVTALIGISDTPGKCAPAGCAGCAASANCAYARTETES